MARTPEVVSKHFKFLENDMRDERLSPLKVAVSSFHSRSDQAQPVSPGRSLLLPVRQVVQIVRQPLFHLLARHDRVDEPMFKKELGSLKA